MARPLDHVWTERSPYESVFMTMTFLEGQFVT